MCFDKNDVFNFSSNGPKFRLILTPSLTAIFIWLKMSLINFAGGEQNTGQLFLSSITLFLLNIHFSVYNIYVEKAIGLLISRRQILEYIKSLFVLHHTHNIFALSPWNVTTKGVDKFNIPSWIFDLTEISKCYVQQLINLGENCLLHLYFQPVEVK